MLARNLVDDHRERAATDRPGAVVLISGAAARHEDGVLVVEGDARRPATLRAAGARTPYACDESSAVNAAVAPAAGTLRSADDRPRLSTFAQVRSLPELLAAEGLHIWRTG